MNSYTMKRSSALMLGIATLLCLITALSLFVFWWPTSFSFSFPQWSFMKKGDVVSPEGEWAVVTRVVDGDTIELSTGEKVRYIGVNTPESVDPRRKVECFGKEASEWNRQLVLGNRVRLERDISERDKYGRLLRFVYLEDGSMVNALLVKEGYAYASPYPPDISKKDMFRAAEVTAREQARGLWSPDTCDGKK